LTEEEREEVPREKYLLAQKREILSEFVDLLDRTGRIGNRNKLLVDLFNREKKAGTGLEKGIAVPHVRTSQAKEFIFAFARSTPGLEFDCSDGGLAHLFFILVAPPYDDAHYLKIYRKLATAFSFSGLDLTREFLDARDEGEILRAMRHLD
jgi:mannitol/fructose-specific phosphotransferase system IIA component (Ntr-type)